MMRKMMMPANMANRWKLAFPVWIGVMSLAFVAKSGWRAWAWMGGGTLSCFALIHGAKLLGWAAELPA